MRKYESEIIEQKVHKLVWTECDRCKKVIPPDDIIENQELCVLSFTGGYGSVFGDEADVECEICQNCLKEIIGGFCRIN
jgi:hypothetical protein